MNIIAFAASNSQNSINKKLVAFAMNQLTAEQKILLDLNDFNAPIYSIDFERESGIPHAIKAFSHYIENADLILISLAEHNGSYTAVFKNLFDWLSRYKSKCFEGKKVILFSTSQGVRGGRSVMDAALIRFPMHGAEILGHLCVPKFDQSFDINLGIVDPLIKSEFERLIQTAVEFE